MRTLACAVLVLLGSPCLAGAEELTPVPAVAAPAPAAPAAEVPASAAAPVASSPPALAPAATPAPRPFSLQAGWGYYEVLHGGATWHMTDRAALELFGGAGFAGGKESASVGLGFRHELGRPLRGMPWGWDLKALYWSQSDSNYDWKMMSFVAGGFLVRELDPRLSLKLDAGVALSAALESQRNQNQNFATPQRWNASVCLELVYRLGAN